MKLQLLKEKEIPLLKRKRVTFIYNSQDQKTPVRSDVVKIVAKKLGAAQDSVSIRHIYSQFGQSSSKIIVHVYKDKKTMEMYEQKSLIDKHSEKKQEDKEEAPPSSAPAAEEKTEEPKEKAKEEETSKEGASEEKVKEAKAEEEKKAAKAQSSETASADKPEVKKDE